MLPLPELTSSIPKGEHMIAYKATEKQLDKAARRIGVRIIEARAFGRGVRFRLGLQPNRKYGRLSAQGNGRKVAAVCWHGHREFFRALFTQVPEARVQTASTRAFARGHRFYTSETFEDVFGQTDRNVGSMMYSEACECDYDPGHALKTAKITMMRQADLLRCPFAILIPDHYRADGTCKCNDPEEQKMMIKDWGYSPADFARKGVNVGA